MIDEKEFMNKNTQLDDPETVAEEMGEIRVADEVISIVASLAAQEIHGVLDMSSGFADGINHLLGKDITASKGVRISFDGKLVNASVFIIVEYGYPIPEVALEVQEKVKDAIETMTGYEVQFVDVHVQGVAKREKSALEKEAEEIATAGLAFDEQAQEARHKQFFEED